MRSQYSVTPSDLAHLTLRNYLVGAPEMTTAFIETLALRLESFIPDLRKCGDEKVPGLSATVAILRNDLPLHLAWALIKGDDKVVGQFTIGLGSPVGFPFHLYVHPYLSNPPLNPKNPDGRVLFGSRHGRIHAIPADFDLALEIITNVISNGGLYGPKFDSAIGVQG